ncbi:MAG: hypothetical protein NVS2B16_37270 [Chloroflexota bacterium]
MLAYAPRDEAELQIILGLVEASYRFAIGQDVRGEAPTVHAPDLEEVIRS